MFKYASLTPDILAIMLHKGTERPYSGKYPAEAKRGTYLCRGCGQPLFRADSHFTSHCGWPSFDDQCPGAITEEPDADGRRTEILCSRCKGHLGHVFTGEGFTATNIRHCVNAIAIEFVDDHDVSDTEEAILAAGCFWGVEALLKKLPGVLKTEVGYTGGTVENPSYEQVCSKTTGHVEAIRVLYDPTQINYEKIIKYFFEIHDPTQIDGQGPDIGSQYLSKIFYYDDKQLAIAKNVIAELEQLNIDAVTSLEPVTAFWPAEEYHQDYYTKTGHTPYCHIWQKKFP